MTPLFIAPPRRRRGGTHPNWVPNTMNTINSINTINRELGALPPDLFSACCTSDVGVHVDIIASIAAKGIQQEIERAWQREKANKYIVYQVNKQMKDRRTARKGWNGKGEYRFSKNNPHTGGGSIVVSVDTATPRGGGAGNPNNRKQRQGKQRQGSRCNLRLRRQDLPTSRPVALLPCLPPPSCLQRGPYSSHPPSGSVHHATGWRDFGGRGTPLYTPIHPYTP